MPKCLVAFCKNYPERKLPNVYFFRLMERRYDLWMKAIGRDPLDNLSVANVICSEHFRPEDIIPGKRVKIKERALPCLKLKPPRDTISNGNVGQTIVHEVLIKEERMSPVNFLEEGASPKSKNELKNKLRIAKQRVRRLTERVDGLEEALGSLKKDQSAEAGIPQALMQRLTQTINTNKTEFPAELKEFAIKLHSLSPEAYNYVRQTFQFVLPPDYVVRNWSLKRESDEDIVIDEITIKSEPGFQ